MGSGVSKKAAAALHPKETRVKESEDQEESARSKKQSNGFDVAVSCVGSSIVVLHNITETTTIREAFERLCSSNEIMSRGWRPKAFTKSGKRLKLLVPTPLIVNVVQNSVAEKTSGNLSISETTPLIVFASKCLRKPTEKTSRLKANVETSCLKIGGTNGISITFRSLNSQTSEIGEVLHIAKVSSLKCCPDAWKKDGGVIIGVSESEPSNNCCFEFYCGKEAIAVSLLVNGNSSLTGKPLRRASDIQISPPLHSITSFVNSDGSVAQFTANQDLDIEIQITPKISSDATFSRDKETIEGELDEWGTPQSIGLKRGDKIFMKSRALSSGRETTLKDIGVSPEAPSLEAIGCENGSVQVIASSWVNFASVYVPREATIKALRQTIAESFGLKPQGIEIWQRGKLVANDKSKFEPKSHIDTVLIRHPPQKAKETTKMKEARSLMAKPACWDFSRTTRVKIRLLSLSKFAELTGNPLETTRDEQEHIHSSEDDEPVETNQTEEKEEESQNATTTSTEGTSSKEQLGESSAGVLSLQLYRSFVSIWNKLNSSQNDDNYLFASIITYFSLLQLMKGSRNATQETLCKVLCIEKGQPDTCSILSSLVHSFSSRLTFQSHLITDASIKLNEQYCEELGFKISSATDVTMKDISLQVTSNFLQEPHFSFSDQVGFKPSFSLLNITNLKLEISNAEVLEDSFDLPDGTSLSCSFISLVDKVMVCECPNNQFVIQVKCGTFDLFLATTDSSNLLEQTISESVCCSTSNLTFQEKTVRLLFPFIHLMSSGNIEELLDLGDAVTEKSNFESLTVPESGSALLGSIVNAVEFIIDVTSPAQQRLDCETTIKVSKPFYYVIKDSRTLLPISFGKIVDPSKGCTAATTAQPKSQQPREEHLKEPNLSDTAATLEISTTMPTTAHTFVNETKLDHKTETSEEFPVKQEDESHLFSPHVAESVEKEETESVKNEEPESGSESGTECDETLPEEEEEKQQPK